jgi:hypothetical protein
MKRRTGIEPASSPWKGEALPLSYHRADEAAPLCGAASMTVCTNDVALVYLVEDALPIAIFEALRDAEPLVAQMVELKHHWVALAAVHAGVIGEVAEKENGALRGDNPLPRLGGVDIPLAIRGVVLLLVIGATGPAVIVTLSFVLPPPGKLLDGLRLSAAATAPHAGKLAIRTDVRLD